MAVIRLFLILSAMLTVPAPLVFADLNVSLLTLEPGPTVFESFGHSAIMIEDSERPELPVIYQYGQTDVRSFWTGKNLLQNLQKLFDQKLTTRPERFESPRLSNGFPKYFDDKLSPLSNRAIIKSALTLSAEQTSRFIEMLDADYRAGALPLPQL
jgi:hypothetical protein